VERRPHEKDRRAYRIRLKPAGEQLYLQLRQLAIELQSGVLAVLPQARREDFLTQLAAVADACREAAEHSPKRGK
jgi:DNA-binding MarR family transcriptional regulator